MGHLKTTHYKAVADYKRFENELTNQDLEQQKIAYRVSKLEQGSATLQTLNEGLSNPQETIQTISQNCIKLMNESRELKNIYSRLSELVFVHPQKNNDKIENISVALSNTLNVFMDKMSELDQRIAILENQLRNLGVY